MLVSEHGKRKREEKSGFHFKSKERPATGRIKTNSIGGLGENNLKRPIQRKGEKEKVKSKGQGFASEGKY